MEVRERAKQKRPVRKVHTPAPDPQIVYTQPKPFNRNRFLLRMLTVVAVVLAVIFGMSIFFKVETVAVAGGEKYTPWEVLEASGIQEGDHLLTLSRAQITGRIRAKLPYVDEIQIGIKLPDTVNIEIRELDVVYAAEDADRKWWLITAEGRIVDQTTMPDDYTQVLGITLDEPQVGDQAKAVQPEVNPQGTQETQTDPSGATTLPPPVVVLASDQLEIALKILSGLEKNGIYGTIASVDVSVPEAVELWYGGQFQILLGNSRERLDYKLTAMAAAIEQMATYQGGVLDVSFTTWPNQVGYTPFS